MITTISGVWPVATIQSTLTLSVLSTANTITSATAAPDASWRIWYLRPGRAALPLLAGLGVLDDPELICLASLPHMPTAGAALPAQRRLPYTAAAVTSEAATSSPRPLTQLMPTVLRTWIAYAMKPTGMAIDNANPVAVMVSRRVGIRSRQPRARGGTNESSRE
jgi:hypothetical protein